MQKFTSLIIQRNGELKRLDISNPNDYIIACYLLRDVRAGKSAKVHPWLLHTASLLQAVTTRAYSLKPIVVTSGYRTRRTNTQVGGASKSYHMANERGFFHAMDCHVDGVPTDELAKYALAIQQGGVGIYNNKGFVHIDVGPPRKWVDV